MQAPDLCYAAVTSRDTRFDGAFVMAVATTRIYCRPSCPARTPRRENVAFYPTTAAAQRDGYRACLRCRPDAAPGSPDWNHRRDTAGRAMRLIADGTVDREGVPGLAQRLGYTPRHLGRLLRGELGAGPLELARAHRAQTARVLIETTAMPFTEVAFGAGFGSIRQFNHTVTEIFGRSPSALRDGARRRGTSGAAQLTLRLPYRAPLHVDSLLSFLAVRALDGVEVGDATRYVRTLRLPHGPGVVTLHPMPGYVRAELALQDLRDVSPAVARCRRLLDLDADPTAVDGALATVPVLAEDVARRPGVRVARAVDGFELACRVILGQQISVAAARNAANTLVSAVGEPAVSEHSVGEHCGVDFSDGESPSPAVAPGVLFPTAAAVRDAPDSAIRTPASRRHTLRELATLVADGELDLTANGADWAAVRARLLAVPGIGPWTADLIAMRALGDPDVGLPNDLVIKRAGFTSGDAVRCQPWRSYAVMRLWTR